MTQQEAVAELETRATTLTRQFVKDYAAAIVDDFGMEKLEPEDNEKFQELMSLIRAQVEEAMFKPVMLITKMVTGSVVGTVKEHFDQIREGLPS